MCIAVFFLHNYIPRLSGSLRGFPVVHNFSIDVTSRRTGGSWRIALLEMSMRDNCLHCFSVAGKSSSLLPTSLQHKKMPLR